MKISCIFVIILIFIVVFVGVSMLVSCDNSEDGPEFSFVGSGSGSLSIYRHNKTDVLYIVRANGGVSVMLGSDGRPLVYSEWYGED